MSDYIMYDMWIHDGCVEDGTGVDRDPFVFVPGLDRQIIHERDGFTVTPGPGPHPIIGGTTLGIECWWIYLGNLQPGQSIVIIQSYHLMSFVENWAQSDRMTFTMEFFGQQSQGTDSQGNPPAPPQPGPDSQGELPGWGRVDWPPYPCDPPPECTMDDQCDDGVFCNGAETCQDYVCVAGDPPCTGVPGDQCSEDDDACVECLDNTDCEALYGTGWICVDGTCEEPT
jgi:hypothetical protein